MGMTVVVDGGGSGSRLAVFDDKLELLATTQSGPASLTLGGVQAWDNITVGLNSLATQLGLQATARQGNAPNTPENAPTSWLPDKLVMGLAGALQSQRREQFLQRLPAGLDVLLVTDGQAQLHGAAGGQAGICLAVGTGSVLHWQAQSGQQSMAGGWGFPAGDEASGAWLGLVAVRLFINNHDATQSGLNTASEDPLWQVLEPELGSTISAIQHWSTCTNATRLATLVPCILAAAEQGSVAANQLLGEGARACETLLAFAPPNLPVYLVGGLAPVYKARLDDAVQARLSTPRGSVFDGLIGLASQSGNNA